MRSNDASPFVLVFGVGFLLGVLATLAVYSVIADGNLEAERRRTEEALRAAEQERDEAQARILDYLERERRQRDLMEQAVGAEPARPVVPAEPKPAEGSKPRADATALPETSRPAKPR